MTSVQSHTLSCTALCFKECNDGTIGFDLDSLSSSLSLAISTDRHQIEFGSVKSLSVSLKML